ncbi:MAG: hypothetical protein CML48_04505, partial [Rhodobacteraceae bacterium]|nr:hypothetical protein [Paracoccaceae bacterium]
YSSKINVPYIPIMDEDNLPNEFEIFRGQALGSNKEFVSSRGKVEFIEENPFAMKNGSVKTSLFQYKKQDDSKLIEYVEDGLSGFGITGEPLNLLYLENPYVEVVMSSDTSAPIYLNVGCGDSCQATVDLGKFSGDWETKNIPFSCFDKQGFDRSKLTIRSMFLSPKATDFKIHTVKIKSNFSGRSIKGC